MKRIKSDLCKVKKKKNDFICTKSDLLLDKKKKKTFERGSTFMRQIYYACITY